MPPTKTFSLSSGHFESLLELPLWLILLPTLGALHQSQIGSLVFHANVSVPSVRRTCLVNSRPHKVLLLCLMSALGEAPVMLPGLPERQVFPNSADFRGGDRNTGIWNLYMWLPVHHSFCNNRTSDKKEEKTSKSKYTMCDSGWNYNLSVV